MIYPSQSHHSHLMPLPAHVEDNGAFADLVGDDEEGGGRRRVQRVWQQIVATVLLGSNSDKQHIDNVNLFL